MSDKEKRFEKEYIAVIQAGGLGTRMRELTGDLIPKPMLEINGKPLLKWQMDAFAEYGIREFVVITGHLGEKIEEWFGDGSKFGYSVSYVRENEPLGSAGALYYIRNMLNDRNFVLAFGDVMFSIDLNRAIVFHEEKNAQATLIVHPNSHPYDSDLVSMDADNTVREIKKKNVPRNTWDKNCVNSGLYIFRSEALIAIESPKNLDLEADVITPLIQEGKVFGYSTPEYIKDVGTPERFKTAVIEQRNGVWERRNLRNPQSCIFLDRDGTINRYAGLLFDDKRLELETNAAEAIKLINRSGMLAIVITNQPVVARGLCSIDDVMRIHNKMETLLGEKGAYLDDIAFCPHHPDKGYPGENPEYKIKCRCRKPGTGMVEDMARRYNIDLSRSFMVGDTTGDIQTGINAGLRTVLVKTGEAGTDGKYDVQADYEAADILDAVKLILAAN